MPRKRKSGRRTDATGRSKGGDGHHARLYRWEIESSAYRSLSVGARALLVELKALYNGNNNGGLFLSAREAAKRLNAGRSFASRRFLELQDKGFIRPKEIGAFNRKALAGSGMATSWVLTEFPIGNAAAGTKDFMRWQSSDGTSKIHLTVRPSGRCVRPSGQSAANGTRKRPNRPPLRTLSSFLRTKRSAPADTDRYTKGDAINP
jgi:hypothetical protein